MSQHIEPFNQLSATVAKISLAFPEYLDSDIVTDELYNVKQKLLNGTWLKKSDAPLIAYCLFHFNPNLNLINDSQLLIPSLNFLERYPSDKIARILLHGWLNIMPDNDENTNRIKQLICQHLSDKSLLIFLDEDSVTKILAQYQGGSFQVFLNTIGQGYISQKSKFIQKLLGEISGSLSVFLNARFSSGVMREPLLCFRELLFTSKNELRAPQITGSLIDEGMDFFQTSKNLISYQDLAIFKDLIGDLSNSFKELYKHNHSILTTLEVWQSRSVTETIILSATSHANAHNSITRDLYNAIQRILLIKNLSSDSLSIAAKKTSRDKLFLSNYGKLKDISPLLGETAPNHVLILKFQSNDALVISIEIQKVFAVLINEISNEEGIVWENVLLHAKQEILMGRKDTFEKILKILDPELITEPPKLIEVPDYSAQQPKKVPSPKKKLSFTDKDRKRAYWMDSHPGEPFPEDQEISTSITPEKILNNSDLSSTSPIKSELRVPSAAVDNPNQPSIDEGITKQLPKDTQIDAGVVLPINNNPFSYKGRLRRTGYVLSVCALFLSSIAIFVILSTIFLDYNICSTITSITLAILLIFASMKRFRDLKLSPYMSACLFVPLLNWLTILYLCFKKSKY